MKTIPLLAAILLYTYAASIVAGNDDPFDGGVPKKLGGGVPKQLGRNTPKKSDADVSKKAYRTKAAEKQIAPTNSTTPKATTNTSWQIGFRVDEIVPDQGFISRNQCRADAYLNSLIFITMTNTATLNRGDWLGGLVNEFREAGVMTNDNEQLRVIVPAAQLRIIIPPRYDKY